MKKVKAVVLGSGPLGVAVGREFVGWGAEVKFVTRSGKPVAVPGTQTVAADVRDAAALTAAVQGADLVVHAVGVPYPDWFREFPPMQTAVLAAAEATGALAVFAENLYSYSAAEMPLRQGSPEVPPTRKGLLRKQLADQWMEAHRSGKIRGVSVRASDYLGPGATRSANSHFGSRFFPAFEAGKPAAFLGNPDAPHSFTYLPDFARALVDVALDEGAWGRSWMAPSMGPTTARTVAEGFAKSAGRPVKVGRLPSFVVRLLGMVNPMVREVGEMLYQFDRPFTLDSSDFETRYGWKATPLNQAIEATWADHLKTAER